MNAKELRAAAEWLSHAASRYFEEYMIEDHDDLDSRGHFERIDLVTDHILGTVRDDDDEPIHWDWLQTLTGYEYDREVSGSLVSVKVNEELSLIGDIEYPERWQVWFNEYEIGECVDRAGFRSLCRGLGIELKEP